MTVEVFTEVFVGFWHCKVYVATLHWSSVLTFLCDYHSTSCRMSMTFSCSFEESADWNVIHLMHYFVGLDEVSPGSSVDQCGQSHLREFVLVVSVQPRDLPDGSPLDIFDDVNVLLEVWIPALNRVLEMTPDINLVELDEVELVTV